MPERWHWHWRFLNGEFGRIACGGFCSAWELEEVGIGRGGSEDKRGERNGI